MTCTQPPKANEAIVLKTIENEMANNKLGNDQDSGDESDDEPPFPFEYRGRAGSQAIGEIRVNKVTTPNQGDKTAKVDEKLDALDQRMEKKVKSDKKGSKGN